MKKVIVVGAGASGLTAAIAAAREGASVTVLEAGPRPGHKLLLTGSGKCNLAHRSPDTEELQKHYRSSSSRELLEVLTGNIFRSFGYDDTIAFFAKIGLPVIDHDGYIYPRSLKSGSVLQVLLNEAERWKIRLKYNTGVTGLYHGNDRNWHVQVSGWEYPCDCVILASGSPAGLPEGSPDTYSICRSLGIHVNDLLCALSPLVCRERWVRNCAGDRTRGRVYINYEGSTEPDISEYGQIQWVEHGVSGIVVFNLSRYAAAWLSDGKKVHLRIDLLDELTQEEAERQFRALLGNGCEIEKRLCGYLPPHVLSVIAGQVSGRYGKTSIPGAESRAEDTAGCTARAMKNVPLTVTSVRGMKFSQAAGGGVSLDELHPETLEVRKNPGLYVCGELADVDGECGGYNLQWAWSSGMVCGRAAAGK